MERWIGRVALVTGASSGIGASIANALAEHGMKVIGVSRNIAKIQEASKAISSSKGSIIPLKCDLTKDEDIYEVFRTINKTYGGVDVCINNAGLAHNNNLIDGTPDEWRSMMDVNVIAVCLCTKLAVASMRERGVDDGQIININSTSGHRIPSSNFHFYSATKFALKAVTEGLRRELRAAKSHIRASEISPGIVETEFVMRMFNDEKKSTETYSSLKPLKADDVSQSVIYILSTAPHIEVNDIILRPTEQVS